MIWRMESAPKIHSAMKFSPQFVPPLMNVHKRALFQKKWVNSFKAKSNVCFQTKDRSHFNENYSGEFEFIGWLSFWALKASWPNLRITDIGCLFGPLKLHDLTTKLLTCSYFPYIGTLPGIMNKGNWNVLHESWPWPQHHECKAIWQYAASHV